MPDEKIIQIMSSRYQDMCLTNQGRIFERRVTELTKITSWVEIDLPPLNKPKPRAQAKESAYSEEFGLLWAMYGKKGNKKAACRQYELRIKEAPYSPAVYMEIEDGIKKYNKYIDATDQFKKNMETFLGRDKHYLNDFTIPDSAKRQNRVKQEWEFIPENDHLVFDWAKKHGFKVDGLDKIFDTRCKLKTQIKERIESDL